MIQIALGSLDLSGVELLIIENVGNLVCPAEFNLGEHEKIMILEVLPRATTSRSSIRSCSRYVPCSW